MNEVEVRLAVFNRLTGLVHTNQMQLEDIPKIGELLTDWVLNGEKKPEAAKPASKQAFGGKPTVKYDQRGARIVVGRSASVFAVDHYAGHIGPSKWVDTSTVLSYDEATGEFETRNTKYVPL